MCTHEFRTDLVTQNKFSNSFELLLTVLFWFNFVNQKKNGKQCVVVPNKKRMWKSDPSTKSYQAKKQHGKVIRRHRWLDVQFSKGRNFRRKKIQGFDRGEKLTT